MNSLSVLLLGIGLGLRHATDVDHVVVVSALVQREPGIWRAARIAALWGLGHTAAFLAVGMLIVVGEIKLPESFELVAELSVASMLIAFGIWHLIRGRVSTAERPLGPLMVASARPVLIGLVHGLAGSAAIALLAATTIPSRALAAAYLGLFGLGTVLGMVLLTALISRPIGWAMRREGHLKRTVTILSALLSMALGVSVLLGIFAAEASNTGG